MYQSINYNYYTKTATIRDDEKGWVNVPYTPTYYKLDSEGEYFTLEGKYFTFQPFLRMLQI